MSSRLFQEVREKRGLVYTIYSYHTAFRDTGLFGVYAGTGEGQVKELLPTIKGVLEDFPKTLSEQEIERSKAQFKAGMLMALESTSARCEHLAQQMLIYERPLPLQEITEKVDAVTRDDLKRIAESLLAKPMTFAALGPGKEIRWS